MEYWHVYLYIYNLSKTVTFNTVFHGSFTLITDFPLPLQNMLEQCPLHSQARMLTVFLSKRSIQRLPTSQGSWAFQQRDLYDQTWKQQWANATMVREQPGPWRMGSYSEEDRRICQLLQELGQLQGNFWNAENQILRFTDIIYSSQDDANFSNASLHCKLLHWTINTEELQIDSCLS